MLPPGALVVSTSTTDEPTVCGGADPVTLIVSDAVGVALRDGVRDGVEETDGVGVAVGPRTGVQSADRWTPAARPPRAGARASAPRAATSAAKTSTARARRPIGTACGAAVVLFFLRTAGIGRKRVATFRLVWGDPSGPR